MLDGKARSGYYSQTRLARSMGSGDDMFRTWSGPEGSSHKEPLTGTRSHRAHGAFFCLEAYFEGLSPALPGPVNDLRSRRCSAVVAVQYEDDMVMA